MADDTLASILQPNGQAIGRAGEDPSVRIMPGGAAAAKALLATLAAACTQGSGVALNHNGADVSIDIIGGDSWVRRIVFPLAAETRGRDAGMDG
jgi:hypothetical protein